MRNNLELVLHSIKVSYLSFLISLRMNLPFINIVQIIISGLLHDIGKFSLNQKILYKKEKLSITEFEHIKNHVILGWRLLKKFHVPSNICTMVLQHHENMNGTGYPYELKQDEIYIGSRIVKVADVYDSLTSNRIYRSKYRSREALKIMLKDIESYDLNVLRTLIKLVKCFNSRIIFRCKEYSDEN
ncbi:HD-GYP domain-containing protein [Sedimentibacter sp. MB31-C6]|uniref:HD-GYP domain-containing protein n=1 Tax=Sedimentibacter sp. MB31-C6 TaxID=3109366 RepID=UPI002DDCB942|nr:HD domain-containing phosphohydrolase [Sedimentibacter sp. MB36-C1]WSI05135.1 HD domain-containing phosphohydrolase [Sedimentibacter sp. MB36-C1]